jgi:hypothetical protein
MRDKQVTGEWARELRVVDKRGKWAWKDVHIPRLLKISLADVVVGERAPQRSLHVGEPSQTSTDDGVDAERRHRPGVLGDELAQPLPQLVVGAAFLRRKLLCVDDLCELDRGVVQPSNLNQVLDVVLRSVEIELQVTTVHPHCCLGDVVRLDKGDVQWPDTMVLCNGQREKSLVKRAAGLGNVTLRGQILEVVDPDSRHLREKRSKELCKLRSDNTGLTEKETAA